VRSSFLPGDRGKILDKIDILKMHEFQISENGSVLEKGCVYIVPLMEQVRLKWRISAVANPKSSTGRLDVFTRLITEGGLEFDRVKANYSGKLFAEISPRTFSILVRKSSRLNQIRIRDGSPRISDKRMRELSERENRLAGELEPNDVKGGYPIHVDLRGLGPDSIIGFRAKRNAGLIDVDKVNHYDWRDFWDPVYARRGGIILNPDDFYILASKEPVRVPADHAAEMIAYDTLVGEFRVHYAGFFDPGFGLAEAGGAGTRAVLEVRSHEVPFLIEDGQLVGRLVTEKLAGRPDRLYGAGIGSSYQRQGLALSKHFRQS
jgi:dCTP deaminase